MTDYDALRANAQGRPNPLLPGVPFPLVGVDVIATPGSGFEVAEVRIRNAKTDPYGTNIEFEIAKSVKWTTALVSWLNVGVREDARIAQAADGKITERIWCHEDFVDENVAAVKARIVNHLAQKIEKLQAFHDELQPAPSSRPRP